MNEQAQHVITLAHEQAVTHIDLQFTDVTGMVKAVQIPARQLETAFAQGVWFDGSALESFARQLESDMYLRPDSNTYVLLPGERDDQKIARLICDVYTPGGETFAGDPRSVLKRALAVAGQMNYRYMVAPELEFFLFKEPAEPGTLLTPDNFSYFDVSDALTRQIRRVMCDRLEAAGIPIESAHHETGGGQHELDFPLTDALQAADAVMTARFVVKSVAADYGLYATFMPKPLPGVAGSGMHVHQMLRDTFHGSNVFADSGSPYHLSAVGRSFAAGQLTHARAICAVLAPLVNSYKRLVSGLEAPVYVSWAQANRAALLRVPRVRGDSADEVRIEMRAVDPSCNPYLAFAVMLRAGLDGVSSALELQNPAEENLTTFDNRRKMMVTLPTSLHEALLELERSDLVVDALGITMFERFRDAKQIEWHDYALSVSRWELDRYLRTY